LFELETGMDIGRAIGSRWCTDDDGIGNMVLNMGKVLTHSVKHQNGEEIFFFGYTDSIYAPGKIGELGTGESEALGVTLA
jgi:hypothetical protein